MSKNQKIIDTSLSKEYKYGFITDIESETLPPGLSEDVIATISRKKDEPELLLQWRIRAYQKWLKMKSPQWGKVSFPKIDYQDIS